MLVQAVNNTCAGSVHMCPHVYCHCIPVFSTCDDLHCAAGEAANLSPAVPGPASSSTSVDASETSSLGPSSFGTTNLSMADGSHVQRVGAEAEGQSAPLTSSALPLSSAPSSSLSNAAGAEDPSSLPTWSSPSTGQYACLPPSTTLVLPCPVPGWLHLLPTHGSDFTSDRFCCLVWCIAAASINECSLFAKCVHAGTVYLLCHFYTHVCDVMQDKHQILHSYKIRLPYQLSLLVPPALAPPALVPPAPLPHPLVAAVATSLQVALSPGRTEAQLLLQPLPIPPDIRLLPIPPSPQH